MRVVEPIERGASAADRAFAVVRGRILTGALRVGDRLPPERELAAQLSVNRLTLRTALAKLAGAGLLAVRQGSGYVVRPWRWDAGSELLAPLSELAPEAALPRLLADLTLARRQLLAALLARIQEGVLLASRRAAQAEVLRFRTAAEAGLDREASARHEAAIDGALALAAGSDVLSLCLAPVSRALSEVSSTGMRLHAEPLRSAAAHLPLVPFLDRPSGAAAQRAIAAIAARDARAVR